VGAGADSGNGATENPRGNPGGRLADDSAGRQARRTD
jgi:hypothetical protein